MPKFKKDGLPLVTKTSFANKAFLCRGTLPCFGLQGYLKQSNGHGRSAINMKDSHPDTATNHRLETIFGVRHLLHRFLGTGLAHTSIIYVAGTLLNSAIAFGLISLLTHVLTPHAYGLIAMYQVSIRLMLPILSLNVHAPITVRYFTREKSDLPGYIGTQVIIIFALAAFFPAIFLFLSGPLSKLTGLPKLWIWTLVLTCLCLSLRKVAGALWLARNQATRQVGVTLMENLTGMIFTIGFVVIGRFDWQGRVLSIVIASGAGAVIALIWLLRERVIRISFNRAFAQDGLAFGIPLIPHELGSFSLAAVDRFFITKMVGMAATGIYSAGYQIASLMNIFVESFNKAYVPWLFERLNKNEYATNRKIVLFTYGYFFLITVGGLAVWALIAFGLRFIVGASFLASLPVIPWIVASCVFNGMYLMVTNYIVFAAKTHLIGMLTLSTAVLNAVLTLFLVKRNGMIGAAQATALSYLVFFLLTWALSARVCPMPWFHFKRNRADSCAPENATS